jgi:hypothetical protein
MSFINALIPAAKLAEIALSLIAAAPTTFTYGDVTFQVALRGNGAILTVTVAGFGTETRNISTQDNYAVAQMLDVMIVNRLVRGK